eukprot:403334305
MIDDHYEDDMNDYEDQFEEDYQDDFDDINNSRTIQLDQNIVENPFVNKFSNISPDKNQSIKDNKITNSYKLPNDEIKDTTHNSKFDNKVSKNNQKLDLLKTMNQDNGYSDEFDEETNEITITKINKLPIQENKNKIALNHVRQEPINQQNSQSHNNQHIPFSKQMNDQISIRQNKQGQSIDNLKQENITNINPIQNKQITGTLQQQVMKSMKTNNNLKTVSIVNSEQVINGQQIYSRFKGQPINLLQQVINENRLIIQQFNGVQSNGQWKDHQSNTLRTQIQQIKSIMAIADQESQKLNHNRQFTSQTQSLQNGNLILKIKKSQNKSHQKITQKSVDLQYSEKSKILTPSNQILSKNEKEFVRLQDLHLKLQKRLETLEQPDYLQKLQTDIDYEQKQLKELTQLQKSLMKQSALIDKNLMINKSTNISSSAQDTSINNYQSLMLMKIQEMMSLNDLNSKKVTQIQQEVSKAKLQREQLEVKVQEALNNDKKLRQIAQQYGVDVEGIIQKEKALRNNKGQNVDSESLQSKTEDQLKNEIKRMKIDIQYSIGQQKKQQIEYRKKQETYQAQLQIQEESQVYINEKLSSIVQKSQVINNKLCKNFGINFQMQEQEISQPKVQLKQQKDTNILQSQKKQISAKQGMPLKSDTFQLNTLPKNIIQIEDSINDKAIISSNQSTINAKTVKKSYDINSQTKSEIPEPAQQASQKNMKQQESIKANDLTSINDLQLTQSAYQYKNIAPNTSNISEIPTQSTYLFNKESTLEQNPFPQQKINNSHSQINTNQTQQFSNFSTDLISAPILSQHHNISVTSDTKDIISEDIVQEEQSQNYQLSSMLSAPEKKVFSKPNFMLKRRF